MNLFKTKNPSTLGKKFLVLNRCMLLKMYFPIDKRGWWDIMSLGFFKKHVQLLLF
jgi:hypothetical protein